MAMRLDAGEVGRSDLYAFFPEHIVVVHDENSRKVPHTSEEIEALAERIRQHGQQQPAVVRRIQGNKVQLVAGYGRCQAVAWLNERYSPVIKLQCKVVDLNAEDAFVCSIVENSDRKNTTPIDDAHAQRRLREEFHWSEDRIAEFYKKSVASIGQLRKTLQLSAPLQAKVANGQMPVSTAMDVAKLPEKEREEVVTAATDPKTGKVDGNKVREKVRESGEQKARTMKEVKEFFEGQTGPGESASVRGLSKKVLEFLAGSISEVQMVNALGKYVKE